MWWSACLPSSPLYDIFLPFLCSSLCLWALHQLLPSFQAWIQIRPYTNPRKNAPESTSVSLFFYTKRSQSATGGIIIVSRSPSCRPLSPDAGSKWDTCLCPCPSYPWWFCTSPWHPGVQASEKTPQGRPRQRRAHWLVARAPRLPPMGDKKKTNPAREGRDPR